MFVKLHTLRFLTAVFAVAIVAAIPAFQYLATQIIFEGDFDVAFYSFVALFAGVCFAGGLAFMLMAIRGGTLPAWFVRAS